MLLGYDINSTVNPWPVEDWSKSIGFKTLAISHNTYEADLLNRDKTSGNWVVKQVKIIKDKRPMIQVVHVYIDEIFCGNY